jgi:hypothetical protein
MIHFSGGPVIAYGMALLRTVNAGAKLEARSYPLTRSERIAAPGR